MLKYKEILETIIEILKKNFTESIFIDDESVQGSEVSDELNKLFNRNIKVTDRKLNITKLEQSIKKEESIYVLNFTLTLNYLDSVYEEDVVYENMEEINLNLGE